MSQGVCEGNEQDTLNLEYFRYVTTKEDNNFEWILGLNWTCFHACAMAGNTWPFHQ